MRAGFGFWGLMFVAATSVAPGHAADVDHGRTIAQRWCAACHIIATGQTTAKADAPPFEAIAKSRTAPALRLFLANPYPRMPDMSLSRDENADHVAIIKTYGLAPSETPEPPPTEQDNPDKDRRG